MQYELENEIEVSLIEPKIYILLPNQSEIQVKKLSIVVNIAFIIQLAIFKENII